jgi:hypothetical protein
MKPTVYIETTIPSFYYSERPTPEMIAIRNWTRDWWKTESLNYTLVSSQAVIQELDKGDHLKKREKIAMLKNIPFLHINNSIAEIVEVYIERKVMPKDTTGDALHLAIASFYDCDYLLHLELQAHSQRKQNQPYTTDQSTPQPKDTRTGNTP